jgi:hypothetical protein
VVGLVHCVLVYHCCHKHCIVLHAHLAGTVTLLVYVYLLVLQLLLLLLLFAADYRHCYVVAHCSLMCLLLFSAVCEQMYSSSIFVHQHISIRDNTAKMTTTR